MAPDISICIVLYEPDRDILMKTLDTLATAVRIFSGEKRFKLYIVDNSPTPAISVSNHIAFQAIPTEIIYGQGNIGFGRANNLALDRGIGRYHLVLNPDVELSASTLWECFAFMEQHVDCILLTPAATYPDGSTQFLCKQYPNLFDLLIRGFAPRPIQEIFRGRLEQYEMRRQIKQIVFWDPPIVSGCFMFFRGDIFCRLKGFDQRYMLYFEDFDISLRAACLGRIAYVPSVKIIHRGGNAAKKGLWHIHQFLRSAIIFFTSHKIKLF
ncbi:glycosyltransferase [Brucella pseudogrignonensis]|uniref:glycosyltransferase n=1 Tax=Brucella pseudogrignonensis TaxID=419475 RepID=UPI0028B9FAB4|nr:glycosyltransferase [Brucella pseudogrignonensis]MDT6941782.1 glycosyltransferase [Brucella pseudogrignonensis]